MPISRLIPSILALAALAACAPDGGDAAGAALPTSYELARDTGDDSAPISEATVIDLSPEQVQARLGTDNVRLIDVRTDAEVAEGVIPGAEHIALDTFDPSQLDPADTREIVLYCRSGRRSAIAATRLAEHTGAPAQHLEGGILAWQEAGYATEK